MKETNKRFIGWPLRNLAGNGRWLKLGLGLWLGLCASLAGAQPANDNFTNAIAITGAAGTVGGTNNGASLEVPCESTNLLFDDLTNVDNSVWYVWTAPASGAVTFDTIGSGFDTVLAVYTTTNNTICSATQIAGNDNYKANTLNSRVVFTVTAGKQYYVSVNGNPGAAPNDAGSFVLNWYLTTVPSGNFVFTSGFYPVSESDSTGPNTTYDGATVNNSLLGARITVTRTNGFRGRLTVGYKVSALTYTNVYATNFFGTNVFITLTDTNNNVFQTNYFSTNTVWVNQYQFYDYSYQTYNVTNETTNVTTQIIVGGNSTVISGFPGLTTPNATNLPPLGSFLLPPVTTTDSFGDIIITVTNIYDQFVTTNQIVTSASGIATNSGTLTFDDYQMSADILVPVNIAIGPAPDINDAPYIPSLAQVALTGAQLDPLESAYLEPPVLGGPALINALSPQFPPGPELLNFERSTFRVDKDVGGTNAIISVYRYGTNNAISVSVDYSIDPTTLFSPFNPFDYTIDAIHNKNNPANLFPLQADSEYATANGDYTPVTGTLTWAANDYLPKTITIPIINNGLVEFNTDFLVQLHNAVPQPTATTYGAILGEVNAAYVTILFDDLTCGQQPAGAVDRCWNKDGATDSNPPFLKYPGTQGGQSGSANGNGGTVYAVAEQPDGKTIVAGSFVSFDSNPYNYIVRLLNNGYQDTSFLTNNNNGGGANGFIASVVLQPDGKILVGGNFTSFNGYNRHHIARLNSNGSVDTTFNPGLGVNGPSAMVWSIALQPSGQVVIAGNFSSVNGTNLNSVARLNADGSLDASFNPGVGPDGTVNAVAVDSLGRVIIGGDFDTVSGTNSGGVARLNLDGTVDPTFTIGIGTYNPDTGFTDPVHALAIQPDGQILVGGAFSFVDLNSYNGLVRLNMDGTVDTSFNPGTGTYNQLTGISDTVYAITLQPDGNILIGGDFASFNQTRRVGVARLFSYGSVDTSFMDTAYNQFAGLVNHYSNPSAVNLGLYPSGNYPNFVYSIGVEPGTTNVLVGGGFLVVGGGSTRTATHPRSNIARLIGGATPGPGNIQFAYGSYSVDKSAGTLFVSMVRTNGSLGPASASFSTNMAAPGPGIASAKDFSITQPGYFSPLWPTLYSQNINWSYTISPAFYGPNYLPIPQNLQVVTSAYVYLQINNNSNISGNVNANLALSNPNGNLMLGGEQIGMSPALGPQVAAPLTIIDDNIRPGTFGFSVPQFTVTEDGGTATITVIRTGGSDGVVTLSYATSDGSSPNGATNGVDYIGVTNTLSFLATETSHTFTIPIINGTTVRPDRTLNLTLFNVTGGAGLGLTNATLTIINGNFTSGHISFTSGTFGTNENAGYALVTVNRLGGNSGTISVTAITSNGTAVNGVNYIGSTNTLTWNNSNTVPQTIAIPLRDDGLVTADLTVNLRLTNGILNSRLNNNVLGLSQYTNAVLTISNVDSAGKVQFSSAAYSVKKYGGYALIPVVRVGGSAQTVDVDFLTTDGSAAHNVNYSNVTTHLHFVTGMVSTNIVVPIIDDGTVDGPLALNLFLTNASPATAMGTISNALLTIIDTASVNETPGSPDTTYNAFGFNNTVYALALQSNNKLLAGGDFTLADGVPRQRIARLNSDGTLDSSFLLPSSSSGANGTVRSIAVQADGRILVGGQFTGFDSANLNYIARLNLDGSLDSLFNPGSGADNPVYAVAETFVGGQSKVLLGGGFASVSGANFGGIARLNSDGTPDTTFNPGLGANGTVYALAVQSDGKVVIGGDFTAVNGNTNFNHIARLNIDGSVDINFNPGTGASDSLRAVTLQLDGRILLGGLFTSVNGTNLNHIARLNADGSVDATFNPGVGADDAVFGIALQTDNRIVLGGEFAHCSGVTRSRITRLNPDGTVDPTINFGWGANNFVAAVVIQEDTIVAYPTNAPDEKIIIGGGFTQYDHESHPYLARIYGGSIAGSGAFEFTSAYYSADENSTNVTITVLRTGGTSGTNASGSSDVLLPFATSDGTGKANTNYLAVSTNLDFPLGEVIRTVVVPVLDDHVITPNLTVNLALTPMLVTQYGDQPTALLTIINDDSSISFSAANYQVPKNIVSGVAPVSIVRQGSVNGTSTVAFSTTTGGTATVGLDYTPVSTLVTFAPGVSNVVMSIPVTNNLIFEGNQTVTMQLASATGSLLYSPSNATLTIVDTVNSPGEFSFAAMNYYITEGGGVGYTNAYITVQRTYGSSGSVTVNYSTVDGTAVAGIKYYSTNGSLTFGDGETSKTFPVQVINNTTAEGPESLSVVLSSPTGGATLTSPASTTLTILNTNTGIAFFAQTNSIREPSGVVASALVLNLVRYNNTNGSTSVQYSTTNGTALASTNFIAVSGTVTFADGQSVTNITVPILHDPRVTGDLSFTVGLFNPGLGAQLTAPSTATVVIHDADAGISLAGTNMGVLKNSGSAFVPVLCSNPAVEPVSVHYSTGPGTAVAGIDYHPVSGVLTFTNGQTVSYISVPIVPNNLVENNRNFTVSLFTPTAPGVLVAPTTETVTIIETNSPYGLSFFSPLNLGTNSLGSTNVDNTPGLPENSDPNIAGYAPSAPVWFQWTAPADGEVTMDTIGSITTNGMTEVISGNTFAIVTNGATVKLDTVLGVFTGSSLASLNQVAANDDIYPQQLGNLNEAQYNYIPQNIFNTNIVVTTNTISLGFTNLVIYTTNFGVFNLVGSQTYPQPFGGPSGLRFNAKAGTTYYIAADTKLSYAMIQGNGLINSFNYVFAFRGPISLNWAYHPSGVFRFATEDVDVTGNLYNGNPLLLYECSETESAPNHRVSGSVDVKQFPTTYSSYYHYDALGLLVTVTRVAGSSGRVAVDYTTVDGNTNVIVNGDIPAVAGVDYTTTSGTLVFDDFEMSKTILIPIIDDNGLSRPNRDFGVALFNPRVDPTDSAAVSPPRVDNLFGVALCRILDCDIDPKGPSSSQVVNTNVTPAITNIVISLIPTNGIFNFPKKAIRVPRDVQSAYWHGTPVTIYVNRMGTNDSGVTLAYRVDNFLLDKITYESGNNYFPLQPGSDYATPPSDGVIFGPAATDFATGGGESGTITFPSGNTSHDPQPIHFTINNNLIPSFNKDIHIGLYQLDSKGNPQQDGMVAECTLTILFDDLSPPAGSVDEFYNPDFGTDLKLPTNSVPIGSAVTHPGTEPSGEVYGTLVTASGQTLIGGAFSTYTDGNSTHTVNGLARLNLDGSLDTTFNANNGINVIPGHQYIRALALATNNEIFIGGHFTSYNNNQRQGVALVNTNGALDMSFNSAGGANGTVYSILVQTDGKVLIGGDFTAYDGTTRNHIARLNLDGSLDTTFDPSNVLTGPVYAMALAPSILFNGSGGTNENDQPVNLGPLTAGLVTVNYNFQNFNVVPAILGPNDLRIYYGDTNVTAGTGVLIYDSGYITGAGTVAVPFAPTGGITTNLITVVMNQGGNPNGPATWTYSGAVTEPPDSGILVGGQFNVTGQSYANIARLNANGSLDTTFSPTTGADTVVRALGWQLNNQIVAGGDFTHVNGAAYNHLVRLNTDGSLDSSFAIGTGTDNSVYSVTLQQLTGTMYVGGAFTTFNGTHRLGFARLYNNGTVDTTFLDTAYNQLAGLPRIHFTDAPGTVYSSGIQSDGNVIIGGSFAQVGGGQFDELVRSGDYTNDVSFNGVVLNANVWPEPKTRDGVRNRGNIARLIGGATPGPGNIGLANTSYAANKTQSYESVSLVRTNGSLGYATANFSVMPGLAQNGVDYSYNSSAPVYPIEWLYFGANASATYDLNRLTRQHSDGLNGGNGLMLDTNYNLTYTFGFNGPAAVNVSIINNTTSSGNLSAQFQLANPGADEFYLGGQNIPLGVALGTSLAPLTVVDNSHQDGVFGFAASSFPATGSTVSVGVARTNSSSGTVQLSYTTTTSGSTAVPGTDYSATSGVLTFNPGQTSGAFPVSILQNSSISSVEKTIGLQLYNIQDLSSGNATLVLSNAVIRIINPNFAGYLNFSTNAYAANLSSGVMPVTVTRTVGSQGTLTVQYATTDGTAVNGTDYNGTTNTLTWNNGDATPRTINIPLINNHLVGPNKQFFASLLNATLNGTNTPSLLGATTSAVLNINNDNSYGTFEFSQPSYRVNENGGYATMTVTRTGSALGTAAVGFTTANGTAFAGTNYVTTNGVLAFAAGQLTRSFNVRLLNDGKTNPPPAAFYFTALLTTNSAGSSLGSPATVPVNIVDAQSYNEPPGSPDSAFDPSAGMNGSVFALALQSGGQIVAGGNFTIVNGASINRLARLNTDGTLDDTFLNGESGADAAVNALITQTDDRIVVGGAFANIDGIVRHRIARLMTDGELDTSFNPGAGADNTIFALNETFINGVREIYVGGAFSTLDGTASPGVARLNDDGSVDTSFATGLGANGTVYAVVAYPTNSIANAGKVLVGGAFTNFNNVTVGNLVRLNTDGSVDTNFNMTAGANSAVRAITIQSDDNVLIGGDFTSVEGTALNHVARLNADGSVDTAFATSVGAGASSTVNAIAVQPDNRIVLVGNFTQANGVTRNSITRLLPTGAVDPTINFGDGANNNIYAVVIQPTDGMFVIGGDFTTYDDQPHEYIARIYGGSTVGVGAFEFTAPTYSVNENGGYAIIGVRRTGGTSGPNLDGSGDVFVTFATSNNTAVAGVNYGTVVTNLDFQVGETFRAVLVPMIDDLVITPNLTVNLNLSNPTAPAGFGNQSTALLTIINTDSALSFLSTSYSVPKNAVTGVATIDIVRQGSTSGSCSVNFLTTTNGSAISGTDYYPTNLTVTFNPGDTDKTALVPIINNLLPEGFRTVALQLTNTVGTLLYSPSNAVLTIIDTVYSPGQLSFAATNFIFSEGNTNAYLTVLRTNGSSGAVSVTYTTVAGTARPGQDYVPETNTLAFGDGVTSNAIVIPLIQNTLVQPPVNLSVVLSSPQGGAQLISPTNTTLTIVSDNTGVSFVSGTNYVSESTNYGLVYVQRIGVPTNVFTVNYATADGTALSNVNYSVTAGTLSFASGEVLKSVSVPLINAHGVTNVAFGMTLTNATPGIQIASPSNAVVIIQPSNAGLSFTNSAMSVFKNVGFAVITVVCSNPGIEPPVNSNTVPLSVYYYTSDGTALAGRDYTNTAGTLVFTNGVGTNTFTVPIINNSLITGSRTFTVNLTNATAPGKITSPSSQAVTIIDSNAGLSFSSAAYIILKTGVATNITVVRTDNTNLTSTVSFATADGTAVAGTDYVATNGILTFTNGVTSQTFALRVIATTSEQPDKTVLISLSNPTNGILAAPSAAILTIRDNSGSLVVPAGSALVSESYLPPNGIIDPGESVNMLFGFRVSAGNPVNLTATLLTTNGVSSPSGPQNYGTLVAYKASAFRAFSFTANGTNSQRIAATFQLANGVTNLGQAAFTFTLGTWTNTFANTNLIIFNDDAPASPYPSMIVVSNMNGVVIKATVTLTNLYHAHPSDIDALVVSPAQQDTLIMAHAGGGNAIGKVTLTFDDAATNSLPPTAYPQTTITNGTYKPTSYLPKPVFP